MTTDPAGGPDRWEDVPRRPPAREAPLLAVDGFEGPLDWLLEMARSQRIDLSTLSILALIDSFIAALDAGLADRTEPADLSSWADWLVMAATLAMLRSRLLLPPDAPEARTARDEAEAIRRQVLERAAMRQAAAWLDHLPQLGREFFGRGGGADPAASGRVSDITDLFRACLAALRVPESSDASQFRRVELWRVPDAMARIRHSLASRPEGGTLASFLPAVAGARAERELRSRAAVASTFLGGLELARDGSVALQQEGAWHEVWITQAPAATW